MARSVLATTAINSGTLVFDSDFSGDWIARFGKGQYAPSFVGGSHAEQVLLDGDTALRVHFISGAPAPNNGMFFIMPITLADAYKIEIVLRLKPGFLYNHTGKLLGGFKGGAPVARPTGTNFFASRPVWKFNGNAAAYIYHMGQQDDFGDNWELGSLTSGVFHTIRHELILNTIGSADGIVRYWLNDVLSFSKSDFRFRTTSSLKIDRVALDTFFGGNQPDEGPLRNEYIDFRRMKIWAY